MGPLNVNFVSMVTTAVSLLFYNIIKSYNITVWSTLADLRVHVVHMQTVSISNCTPQPHWNQASSGVSGEVSPRAESATTRWKQRKKERKTEKRKRMGWGGLSQGLNFNPNVHLFLHKKTLLPSFVLFSSTCCWHYYGNSQIFLALSSVSFSFNALSV